MVSDKNLLITFMFSANMWKIDAIISMKNDFVVLETSAHKDFNFRRYSISKF